MMDSPPASSASSSPSRPLSPEDSPHWLHASARGWSAWLDGGPFWHLAILGMVVLHLSFFPWPPSARTPWIETAWDTHLFAIQNHPGVDFFSIYEAGYRALRGVDPYSVNEISASNPPLRAPYTASFRYLPVTAWALGGPLSLLPPWWSYFAWLALNELLLFLNLGLTAAYAPPSRRRLLGALWLVFFPLHIEWFMGQFSFFMGCLMFWTALALWRGTPELPGAKAKRLGDRSSGGALPGAGWTLPWGWGAFAAWGASAALKNWTLLFWPWWLRKGGRAAWLSTAWTAFLVLSTLLYFFFTPRAAELLYQRGAQQRWAGGMDDLYWGRQGVQAGVAAVCAGGKLPEMRPRAAPSRSPNAGESPMDQSAGKAVDASAGTADGAGGGAMRIDPARWINLAFSLAVLLAALGAIWFLPKANPLDLFSLVWLWWFFGYLDAWEHHYVMLLPWLAIMGLSGRIPGWSLWTLAILWGAPSLLWAALPAAAQKQPSAPFWILLYFIQRPAGVLIACGLTFNNLLADWRIQRGARI